MIFRFGFGAFDLPISDALITTDYATWEKVKKAEKHDRTSGRAQAIGDLQLLLNYALKPRDRQYYKPTLGEYEDITKIDFEKIRQMGIRLVVLDVGGVLTTKKTDRVEDRLAAKIAEIRDSGMYVIGFTNSRKEGGRNGYLKDELKLHVVVADPLKGPNEDAYTKLMGYLTKETLDPELKGIIETIQASRDALGGVEYKVLVVGNRVRDIFGANRLGLGIETAMVRTLPNYGDCLLSRIFEYLERNYMLNPGNN
ncbi:hypothetical protein HYU11_02910 [Candidatus Woesearchaeota archaeon]|nr:hypothetical protein [Candidatus Woesearchaeota archaeon]